MKVLNSMKTVFDSRSVNEAYARCAAAAFLTCADPALDEVCDIKTAVSEAVTNCIVHGYRDSVGKVYITVKLMEDGRAVIQVKDKGCGIENIAQARQPLFTTAAEDERAGLGFAVMESCMDKVRVYSRLGKGTTVVLEKKLTLK